MVKSLIFNLGDNTYSFPLDDRDECRHFELKDMPNLIVLKLKISLRPQYPPGERDHIMNLVKILDTASESNTKLAMVALQITEIPVIYAYQLPSRKFPERHWGSLDQAIVNLQKTLGKRFKFVVSHAPFGTVGNGECSNTHIRTRLPLTFANPLIHSRFTTLDIELVDA